MTRALWIASLFSLVTFAAHAQNIVDQKGSCFAPGCADIPVTSNAPVFPTKPTHGKWDIENYKRSTDASVSCVIVKYVTESKPEVDLLCPGPQIYAPLRVHLALTWAEAKDVPAAMQKLQLDTNAAVRFKSKPGSPMAELTLRNGNAAARKEWISFNKISVALVLEAQK